jgi:multicomponent Na+:H+ antiporter subunit F
MNVVVVLVTGMLLAAGGLVTFRLVRGPSLLDRLVATDALLAIITSGLCVLAAYQDDSTVVPVLVVVSLLGFMGSVAVTRLLVRENE